MSDLALQGFMKPLKQKRAQKKDAPIVACDRCQDWHFEGKHRKGTVSDLDLRTLDMAIREHVAPSYVASLKRCAEAGLVLYDGSSKPVLTEAGKASIERWQKRR